MNARMAILRSIHLVATKGARLIGPCTFNLRVCSMPSGKGLHGQVSAWNIPMQTPPQRLTLHALDQQYLLARPMVEQLRNGLSQPGMLCKPPSHVAVRLLKRHGVCIGAPLNPERYRLRFADQFTAQHHATRTNSDSAIQGNRRSDLRLRPIGVASRFEQVHPALSPCRFKHGGRAEIAGQLQCGLQEFHVSELSDIADRE